MNRNDEAEGTNGVDRRSFITKTLAAGAGVAAWAASPESAAAQKSKPSSSRRGKQDAAPGRRRLGKLEVSAVGMGVQNMHRRYETTVPYRPEMVAILRAAYDRGITFFDTAEAYGPWENERILGEAIQPFRNKVRITSQFGWNIDQQTGRRLPGLNSKPDHIKVVVENSLKRLRTDHEEISPRIPRRPLQILRGWGVVRTPVLQRSRHGRSAQARADRPLPLDDAPGAFTRVQGRQRPVDLAEAIGAAGKFEQFQFAFLM